MLRHGEPLAFADVLALWRRDDAFVAFFVEILAASPFRAYRWETPPVTVEALGRPFEFVVLDDPGLDCEPDPSPFRRYFEPAGPGIVVFENLGQDALLVVPSPRTEAAAYGHLAAFVRSAPAEQVRALWRRVPDAVEQRLDRRPLWLSTAGRGVAWLHLRLDSRPKYYAYTPYRAFDDPDPRGAIERWAGR